MRTKNQAKSKCTKSAQKVQNKLKSTQTVCKKCEQRANCLFIAESWGGPPQMQYFDISQFFSHFLSTFELVLNFPFKIHWFS